MPVYITITCEECGESIQKEAKYVKYMQKRGRKFFSKKGKSLGPLSQITKDKMSASHLGVKLSEEHTKAIQTALDRPEVRDKIGEGVKKAYENPDMRRRQYEATIRNLEKPEVRERISEGVQKAFNNGLRERHQEAMNRPEVKETLRNHRLGALMPEEVKEKISKTTSLVKKAYWENIPPDQRRAHMQKAIAASMSIRSSLLEKKVATIFDNLGVEYISQYQLGPYYLDFYLPENFSGKTIGLDIHGCWFHYCSVCNLKFDEGLAQVKRNKDKRREAYIKKCAENNGFFYHLIWEHEFQVLEKILYSILSA